MAASSVPLGEVKSRSTITAGSNYCVMDGSKNLGDVSSPLYLLYTDQKRLSLQEGEKVTESTKNIATTTTISSQQSLLHQNEEIFARAGVCGSTIQHNDRTRSERDSGDTKIHCGQCKLQSPKYGEGMNKLDMILFIE